MNDEEQKVFDALTDEFRGISLIMGKAKIPYYICLQILRDLERQGAAESKQIGMVIKWRKALGIASNELETPILEVTS